MPKAELGRVRAAARELGLVLPEGAAERLGSFAELLPRAVRAGLVGRGDEALLLDRHVLDSLRAAVLVRESDETGLDMGSGAGLPGIPVAVARPELSVTLVDSRRARIAFLEMAVEHLGLGNVRVVHGRIEELADPVDVCFARALAPISASWALARPLLRPGGRLVYFAGVRGRVPPALEGASSLAVVRDPLASAGPLVIMTR